MIHAVAEGLALSLDEGVFHGRTPGGRESEDGSVDQPCVGSYYKRPCVSV